MPSDEGIYKVYLDITSGGQVIQAYQGSEDITIATPTPANIQVVSITITPATVALGGAVTATMLVQNTGGTDGSAGITVSKNFTSGGGVSKAYTVQVPANLSVSVDISDMVTSGQIGSFVVSAGGVSAPFTVTGQTTGVTGVVKLSDTGQAVAGASVAISGEPDTAVLTDSSGRFTIKGWSLDVIYLTVSYPTYAPQMVAYTNLVSGQIVDEGVITLTPNSAIVLVSLKMPSPYSVFKVYNSNDPTTIYYPVGFLVKNISSQPAVATFEVDVNQAGEGSSNGAQVTLAPGASSYWSGIPYPVISIFPEAGSATLVAKVNGEVVGQVNVLVSLQNLDGWQILNPAAPPAKAALGSSATWKLNLYNGTGNFTAASVLMQVTSPSGIVTVLNNLNGGMGDVSVAANQAARLGGQQVVLNETGTWVWMLEIWYPFKQYVIYAVFQTTVVS